MGGKFNLNRRVQAPTSLYAWKIAKSGIEHIHTLRIWCISKFIPSVKRFGPPTKWPMRFVLNTPRRGGRCCGHITCISGAVLCKATRVPRHGLCRPCWLQDIACALSPHSPRGTPNNRQRCNAWWRPRGNCRHWLHAVGARNQCACGTGNLRKWPVCIVLPE